MGPGGPPRQRGAAGFLEDALCPDCSEPWMEDEWIASTSIEKMPGVIAPDAHFDPNVSFGVSGGPQLIRTTR